MGPGPRQNQCGQMVQHQHAGSVCVVTKAERSGQQQQHHASPELAAAPGACTQPAGAAAACSHLARQAFPGRNRLVPASKRGAVAAAAPAAGAAAVPVRRCSKVQGAGAGYQGCTCAPPDSRARELQMWVASAAGGWVSRWACTAGIQQQACWHRKGAAHSSKHACACLPKSWPGVAAGPAALGRADAGRLVARDACQRRPSPYLGGEACPAKAGLHAAAQKPRATAVAWCRAAVAGAHRLLWQWKVGAGEQRRHRLRQWGRSPAHCGAAGRWGRSRLPSLVWEGGGWCSSPEGGRGSQREVLRGAVLAGAWWFGFCR